MKIGIFDEDCYLYHKVQILEKNPNISCSIVSLKENEEPSILDLLILNSKIELAPQRIKFLSPTGTLVLNSDIKNPNEYLQGFKGKVITYGLNNKASVTTSSISDDVHKTVVICIQRSFVNLLGDTVLPQEFSVSSDIHDSEIHSLLAVVTASLLCGVKLVNLPIS